MYLAFMFKDFVFTNKFDNKTAQSFSKGTDISNLEYFKVR